VWREWPDLKVEGRRRLEIFRPPGQGCLDVRATARLCFEICATYSASFVMINSFRHFMAFIFCLFFRSQFEFLNLLVYGNLDSSKSHLRSPTNLCIKKEQITIQYLSFVDGSRLCLCYNTMVQSVCFLNFRVHFCISICCKMNAIFIWNPF
jgi:hypothetical protein